MFSNNYKAAFELLGNEEIKAEILVNLPPKFEYLTETFGVCDQSSLEGPLRGKNGNSSFSLQIATAQTSLYDAGKGKRITIKHTVHRATDNQTGLVFDFKEEGNTWHIQKIAWEDYTQTKGFFVAKASMKRWRVEWLDNLGKNFAYGRSVASQYPIKKNRFGDWRDKPAKIKDKTRRRSRGLKRLDAFYLRTGLWIPHKMEDWYTQGIMLVMPSTRYEQMLREAGAIELKELKKFAHH